MRLQIEVDWFLYLQRFFYHILRFCQILAFSAKRKPGEISQNSHPRNLICAKYQVDTTEKWKWMVKIDLAISHVFSLNKWSSKACKDFLYRRLSLMIVNTYFKAFHIILGCVTTKYNLRKIFKNLSSTKLNPRQNKSTWGKYYWLSKSSLYLNLDNSNTR